MKLNEMESKYLSIKIISCGPSPFKNNSLFDERNKDEQRQLKTFSMYSNSSELDGSCLLKCCKETETLTTKEYELNIEH